MSKSHSIGIIPARYGSTRFPGKPLAIIQGKTMIRRVYEQAKKSSLDEIVVATDDRRIAYEVESFGGVAAMTGTHPNGTNRVAEVARILGRGDIIVNIQGDEPFIEPENIDLVLSTFENSEEDVATLAFPCSASEDPDSVSVVVSKNGKALYFSRASIPYGSPTRLKHVGIYAYSPSTLEALAGLTGSFLEKYEKLEQLKWLEHDYTMEVAITHHESKSIDKPEDILLFNSST